MSVHLTMISHFFKKVKAYLQPTFHPHFFLFSFHRNTNLHLRWRPFLWTTHPLLWSQSAVRVSLLLLPEPKIHFQETLELAACSSPHLLLLHEHTWRCLLQLGSRQSTKCPNMGKVVQQNVCADWRSLDEKKAASNEGGSSRMVECSQQTSMTHFYSLRQVILIRLKKAVVANLEEADFNWPYLFRYGQASVTASINAFWLLIFAVHWWLCFFNAASTLEQQSLVTGYPFLLVFAQRRWLLSPGN